MTAANGTAPAAQTPEWAEEMAAEIARLTSENAALKAKAPSGRGVTFKVSEKGGMSAYGLGRFPVTLYVEQWERLFGEIANAKAFLEANRASLKVKGDS